MANKIPEKVHLNVIFRPEPEGGFTVLVPALPGCITYGKNLEEATVMAKEAISLYLEDMLADGEEIPEEAQVYASSIAVPLPRNHAVHA